MQLLDAFADIEISGHPDGVLRFRDLPVQVQAALAFEAIAFDVVAEFQFAERAALARHLREIAGLLESVDPLQFRSTSQPPWAAHVAGRA